MKRDLVGSPEKTPTKKAALDTEAESPVGSQPVLETKETKESIPSPEVSEESKNEATTTVETEQQATEPKDPESTSGPATNPESTSETVTEASKPANGPSEPTAKSTGKGTGQGTSEAPEPKLKSDNPLLSGAFGSSFGKSAFQSSFGGSFGSSFGSFGGSSIKLKENPWSETKPETPKGEDTPDESSATPEKSTDQYAVVSLEKQELKTGEEEEITVFQARSKLYAMNLKDTASGWKERGVGFLHLNFSQSQNRHRVLMRADALHKVILNIPIGPHTDLHKGFQSSAQSAKFVRLSGAESDGSLYQYALRLQTAELANELYEQLQAAKN